MYDVVAGMKLSDVLRERPVGTPVNNHVMQMPREPQPDFEAMRKLVYGEVANPTPKKQPAAK